MGQTVCWQRSLSPHSLIVFDSAPLLAQNSRTLTDTPVGQLFFNHWWQYPQPLTPSGGEDWFPCHCLLWGDSCPAPNTFETRTAFRGRKPQSIYLLQLIGTPCVVAPLRQVNNKITWPKNVLKQDFSLFLWSNHFQFATEQEKSAVSTTALNAQLPFLSLSRELQYWQEREHTHVLQRATTEIPCSCDVGSSPCQGRREWIQISCDLYTITNSYCFSSPGFVNLSPITFYFVGTI